MLPVIQKAQIGFDLGVPRVVPVGQARAGQIAKELGVIAFYRQLLQGLSVFDAQFDPEFFGNRENPFIGLNDAIEMLRFAVRSFFIRFLAEFLVFAAFLLPVGDHLQQLVGVVFHLDASAVHDDQRGLKPGGQLQGFERVALGQFDLARPLV